MEGHVVFHGIYIIKLIFQVATISVHYGWLTNSTYKSKCRITIMLRTIFILILKCIFVTSLRSLLPFISLFLVLVPRLFVCFFFTCLQEDAGARRGLFDIEKLLVTEIQEILLCKLPSWQP